MSTLQVEAPLVPPEAPGADPETKNIHKRFEEIVDGIDAAVSQEAQEALAYQQRSKDPGGRDFGNLMFL